MLEGLHRDGSKSAVTGLRRVSAVFVVVLTGVACGALRAASPSISAQPAQGIQAQVPAPPQAQPATAVTPGDRPARLNRVEFDDSTGRARVSLILSKPVRFSVTRLSSPDRVAVDLAATDVSPAVGSFLCDNAIVTRIRIGQFSRDVGRVVLDLTCPAHCSVYAPPEDPSVITVEFNYVVTGAEFEARDGAPGFRIAGTGPLCCVSQLLSGPDRIVVDIPGATLVAAKRESEVDDHLIKRVRVAQFTPTVVRAVCDLRRRCSYVGESEPGSGKAAGCIRVKLVNMVREARVSAEAGRTRLQIAWDRPSPLSLEFSSESKEIVLTAEGCDLDPAVSAAFGPDSAGDSSGDSPGDSPALCGGMITGLLAEQAGSQTVRITVSLRNYSQKAVVNGEAGGASLDVYESVLAGKRIVIDPGHGGLDPGAVGYSGLFEKFVNLEIARRLAGDLADGGAAVTLTRSEDTHVFLPDRLRTCAQVGADAFVSIHSNAYSDSYPSGTETFYYGQGSESERLARAIHGQVVADIRLPDRKAKERDFYLLRESKVPATLIEVAFVSNVAEEVLLMDRGFRNRVARAIYRGLVCYFTPPVVGPASPVAPATMAPAAPGGGSAASPPSLSPSPPRP